MDRIVFGTPVGLMALEGREDALTALYLPNTPVEPVGAETPLLAQGREELLEYFGGKRRTFDLPLKPQGTPFQQRVWAALREIPYGETRSYGQIAAQVGNPKAGRAVGMANNRNPIAIIVPCHRVIGANGSLTGYAGGLSVKQELLALERRTRQR